MRLRILAASASALVCSPSSAGAAVTRMSARSSPVGHQPGLEHAVVRLLHQLGNVDAHRAGHGAAAAQGAGVVQQFLPLRQVSQGRQLDQPERAHQRRQRAGLAQVGAAKRFELVDRRVLGVTGGDIEVAGVSAQAAAHARLQVQRGGDADLGHEGVHGKIGARFLGWLNGFFVSDSGAHTFTPRWLKRMPVAPREKKDSKACISLPKGNQTSSNSSVSRCTTSGPE